VHAEQVGGDRGWQVGGEGASGGVAGSRGVDSMPGEQVGEGFGIAWLAGDHAREEVSSSSCSGGAGGYG